MIAPPQSHSADAGIQASSLMFLEAASAGGLLTGQRTVNAPALARLASDLAGNPAKAILTLGRGSSDNAATFARYVIERRLGLVTASMAPSVSALYGARTAMEDCLVLAISQSGRSPDLIESMRQAQKQGARVVALVNDANSPLATEADYLLEIAAGPELSVAATKSFTLALTAVIDLVAEISGDQDLSRALIALPQQLDASWRLDWSAGLGPLIQASSTFVVARGHALGVAQEMALKLKETCAIHAEAFSAAEVRHGPMALVQSGFPVILIGQQDESQPDIAALAADFGARGACVLASGIGAGHSIDLPRLPANPLIEPLLQLQSFYRMCEALSRQRGLDPDRPPHLSKVTRTL